MQQRDAHHCIYIGAVTSREKSVCQYHADAHQHMMCGDGCGQLLAVTCTAAAVASRPTFDSMFCSDKFMVAKFGAA